MPNSSEVSPFIPPRPSPFDTQRGVIPSPLSVGENLESEETSHSRRMPRAPYPYPSFPGVSHTSAQWTPPGQWGPVRQGYPQSHGPSPGHLYGATPGWGPYHPPMYGPPHLYGLPPGPRPHSAPYPPGPLPSATTPYAPMSGGSPYHPHGYLVPYIPGSGPLGPMPLHPDDIGRSFPERPTEEIIRIDHWAVGTHYAPILTPFQVAILDATLVVNPLLSPGGDNPPPDRVFLEYNMLFPVGTARRSTDPPNRSWSVGRHSPATSPRVSQLRIISREFPWIMEIEASRPQHGVTCLDVLENIYEQLQDMVPRQHIASLSGVKGEAHKRKLFEIYYYNRSTARDAPGGSLGEGIRRADWLLHNVMFDGLINDQKYVQEKLGISGPGWKGLRKVKGDGEKDERGNMNDRLQAWPATLVLKLDQRYGNSEMDRESVVTDATDATETTESSVVS